jgi:hypothetical protein
VRTADALDGAALAEKARDFTVQVVCETCFDCTTPTTLPYWSRIGPPLLPWWTGAEIWILKQVAFASGDVPQNVNFAIKSAIALSFLEANGVEDGCRRPSPPPPSRCRW